MARRSGAAASAAPRHYPLLIWSCQTGPTSIQRPPHGRVGCSPHLPRCSRVAKALLTASAASLAALQGRPCIDPLRAPGPTAGIKTCFSRSPLPCQATGASGLSSSVTFAATTTESVTEGLLAAHHAPLGRPVPCPWDGSSESAGLARQHRCFPSKCRPPPPPPLHGGSPCWRRLSSRCVVTALRKVAGAAASTGPPFGLRRRRSQTPHNLCEGLAKALRWATLPPQWARDWSPCLHCPAAHSTAANPAPRPRPRPKQQLPCGTQRATCHLVTSFLECLKPLKLRQARWHPLRRTARRHPRVTARGVRRHALALPRTGTSMC
mmetsp:Transcript_35797/g.101305  ORF Transcript_35797/g.101305 Transcript_35797/m.101305 type:complete len:322 (+) Transcript_35797:1548-2513(+)